MAVLPILAKPIVIPVAVSSTLVEPTGAGMALRGREYVVATPVVTQVEVVAEVVEAAQVVVVAVVPSSVAATPIQVKPTVIPAIATNTPVNLTGSGVHPKV